MRSPCHQDGDSQADEKEMYIGPILPEDIWYHIHSLMPMRESARAASVSRTFLGIWRCYPTLTFSDESLGLNDENVCRKDRRASVFSSKVRDILAVHSGVGLKTLKIHIPRYFSTEDYCHVDSWLQTALTPGTEELTLTLDPLKAQYDLPCSFLSDGSGESIRDIHLFNCSFHPAATLGSLRSLTKMHLLLVRITGEVMERLLCNSPALERLEVLLCDGIVRLKLPPLLQRLSYLSVCGCDRLEAIDNEAPNLSSFVFGGGDKVSIGGTLQVKSLRIILCSPGGYDAPTRLASMMPNVEALTVHSDIERVTLMLGRRSKFLHLRHLNISLHGSYFRPTDDDYLPLANFLSAAPCLETFHLNVFPKLTNNQVSVFDDPPSDLRLQTMQEQQQQHHSRLKNVTIKRFRCTKSLVELILRVVQSAATSLECLTLEVPQRCSDCLDKCPRMASWGVQMEGDRAVSAIRRYIEPKVPSTVKLVVHDLYLCSEHAPQL